MDQQVALGEIPFFSKLSAIDLMAVVRTTETLEFNAGDTIFHKGDVANGLYALLNGELHIYLPATVHSPLKSLKKLAPGQYVGEFGLFDGEPRSASVEASQKSQVMFLPVAAFAALLQSEPTVARGVVDHLGKTLMNHPHSNLNAFEKDLIETSKVPATLKFMQLLCRLIRKANLSVATK